MLNYLTQMEIENTNKTFVFGQFCQQTLTGGPARHSSELVTGGGSVDIKLTGIVIVAGNYGSGKTEVSINLAVHRRRAGVDVRIADLDLVNPYFRTREAKANLTRLGIDVVVPADAYLQADLPILSPAIAGMIRHPSQLVILDTGGDNVGATVLASLAEPLQDQPVRMLQVVNPFRPFTETLEGCQRIQKEIERASRLRVTGIIGNPNLIDDTTLEDLYRGYDFTVRLSREAGLPLEFMTAASHLLPQIESNRWNCPVLPLQRQLVPPWKTGADFGTGKNVLQFPRGTKPGVRI